MNQIGHFLGIQPKTGVTPLNKTNETKPVNFEFKMDPVQLNSNTKLNLDTMVGLKQLSQGVFTKDMLDDLLSTPYVSLDLNG